MVGRILITLLAAVMGLGLSATSVAAGSAAEEGVLREDDGFAVELAYEDDDGGQGTGGTGGTGGGTGDSGTGDSNDGTNSRVTPVTRDRDRSNDDLTRDWTRDGPGDRKRDWSRHQTRDSSRHDTR